MKKYLVGAALVGVLALTSTAASAAVVCNDEGDCWKVKEKATVGRSKKSTIILPTCASTSMTMTGSGKATSIAGATQERDAAIGVAAFGSGSKDQPRTFVQEGRRLRSALLLGLD